MLENWKIDTNPGTRSDALGVKEALWMDPEI